VKFYKPQNFLRFIANFGFWSLEEDGGGHNPEIHVIWIIFSLRKKMKIQR